MTVSLDTLGITFGSVLVLICLCLMCVMDVIFNGRFTHMFNRLFGIFFAQVYYYWLTHDADSKTLRLVVLVIWFVLKVSPEISLLNDRQASGMCSHLRMHSHSLLLSHYMVRQSGIRHAAYKLVIVLSLIMNRSDCDSHQECTGQLLLFSPQVYLLTPQLGLCSS